MKDKEVTCKECNRIFVIRSSELESFSARKKPIPQYCPLCYKRYRAEKAAERKQREDLAWQKKKALEIQHFHDALNSLQSKFDILPPEKVALDTEDKVLYVMLLVSSSRGSEPAWSPYGVSKWALNGLTKGLAQMLLPHGIVINTIAPGSTATELIGIKEGDNLYSNENVAHRLITPDEVAQIAKVMVSDTANMIAGEVIHVSAGRGCFDIR